MAEQESRQVPISEAMRLAIDHHQAGRLAEAEAVYRAVLDAEPAHAGATTNLALIALQRGRPRDAVPALGQAVQREPRNAAHWMNYAVALVGSGDPKAARDALRKAREMGHGGAALAGLLAKVEAMIGSARPAVVETVADGASAPLRAPNLSALQRLAEQGKHAQVEAQAAPLWAQFPRSSELLALLASSLLAQGKFEAAREVLSRAGGDIPGDALIHHLLGLALRRLRRNDEARAAFERSLAIAPDRFDTLVNASANAVTLGEPAPARGYAERALALRPDSVDALRVLADAAAAGSSHAEAVGLYRRAIAIDAAMADLYVNLGDCLNALGRREEAVRALDRALSLRPDDVQAHLNLGAALLRLGETATALAHFRRASDLAPGRTDAHTAYLFCLSHADAVTPEQCFAEHCRVGDLIEVPRRPRQRAHDNDRDPERGLRVGFVSADLRDHAVAYLLEPVWQAMRGGPHQVFAYAHLRDEDAVSRRLRALADAWSRIEKLDDEALAERIRGDRIDVLFDLSGHTTHNRLGAFAMKPAPVQASWIGYPGTTGLPAMDYRFVWGLQDNGNDLQALFREKLVHLRHRVFRPDDCAPAVNRLPALAAARLTFGSFNRVSKIGEAAITLWSRVLLAVPQSRLVIAAVSEARIEQRLRAAFTARGVAGERVEFRPHLTLAQYLALHHDVDIALDTLPFAGETTTQQALWMGVPVLTRSGRSLQQGHGGAILHALGMSDWAARSDDAFVQQAVAAAGDLQGLDALRQGLRAAMARTFVDSAAEAGRELDAALRIVWQRWCAGLPPESFTASP